MKVTADALSFALLHSLWQDAAVGVLLWGALVVLRRRSANTRYVVCCGALALMAALPIATTMVLSEPESPARSSLSRGVIAEPSSADDLLPIPSESRTAETGSTGWMAALRPWMLPVWLAGVLVCSLRLALAGLHTVGLKRHSLPESGPLAATVSKLAARLGVRRAVAVRVSTMMASPATFGVWRPVILLPPATALGITPPQLEALLAHELAHVRRHDYLVNVLQMIAETLFFYHPVVWWTSRRIRIERELCCDDIAVQACGDAVGYAQALTRVARLLVTEPGVAVGAAGGPLLVRIQRLLGVATSSRTVSPLWVGVVALVMIVALMLAGPRAQSSTPGTVSPVRDDQTGLRGRVVDAGTGKPVGGASVRAQYVTGTENPIKCPIGDCEPTGRAAVLFPSYRVTADTDGRFDIRGLRPGDYLVAAAAPGYVQRYFGQTSDDMPETTVGVAAGERTTSIDVRLVPAGSVNGRIFSDAGEGLPGVEVQLVRRVYLPGGRQPVGVSFAQTEEGGAYRFRDVTPGEYYVRAYAPPSLKPERTEGPVSYVPSFFSEATDIESAQPIVLAGGQELSGVDFALPTAKTRTVTGRLVDPSGASLSGVAVHLMPYSTGAPDDTLKAPAWPDGRFSLTNVPPADYIVMVMDRSDGRSWNTTARDLSVNDDVNDLLLVAGPSVSVAGRVSRDNGQPLPFDPSELRISARQRTSTAGIHSAGSAQVAADGTFSMRSGTGEMNLRIDGLPPRWFVKSVQLDGVDVTDASFELIPGRGQRFDIALTDRASRLSGTVTDRAARPVPNALVVIFPDDRARWVNPCNLAPGGSSCRSIFTTFSRQQGAYQIDTLPMSRYRVVAVTSLPRNAWTDPEVLDRLWPSSSPLSLDDLGQTTLHLRVVPAPTDLSQ